LIVNKIPDWLNHFPALAAIADHQWLQTRQVAQPITVAAGTVLFRDGDDAKGYVLVMGGAIRVQKMDPNGHEIVLYRVESGQNCMLTTTCLLGSQHYPCEGVAETEVQLVMIPAAAFQHALNGSEGFRNFVMSGIGQRIADLMMLVEDVAFGRMDVRIARMLLQRTQQGEKPFIATHQELATELGTAREVISRVLKQLEQQQMIHLSRGKITIINPHLLAQQAQ